ncbi:hypothetical protein BpHYR1_047220 [Brachionus plicatilis]|uniref:Uncharacterized protein n=1 Tax=Brachionus plicatilis TaxID=10195 RepID=A0A3M7T5B5_BRAPC|nr:hypothetical protein BpHYR1_047220 [Brachionus plicatilis]
MFKSSQSELEFGQYEAFRGTEKPLHRTNCRFTAVPVRRRYALALRALVCLMLSVTKHIVIISQIVIIAFMVLYVLGTS